MSARESLSALELSELSEDTIKDLVRAFVRRHPGETEESVMRQLNEKALRIIWDPYEQSSQILTKDEFEKITAIHS